LSEACNLTFSKARKGSNIEEIVIACIAFTTIVERRCLLAWATSTINPMAS